jgi:hypothetical protein
MRVDADVATALVVSARKTSDMGLIWRKLIAMAMYWSAYWPDALNNAQQQANNDE